VPLTAAQMEGIAGMYWDRDQGDFTKVQVKDGKLEMGLDSDDLHELKPFAPDHFHVANVPWGNDVDFHFIAGDAEAKSRRQYDSAGNW